MIEFKYVVLCGAAYFLSGALVAIAAHMYVEEYDYKPTLLSAVLILAIATVLLVTHMAHFERF